MERLYSWIVDRAVVVLCLLAAVTIFLGNHARRIDVDSSTGSLLPRGDPARVYYQEIRALYGSDEIGVVAVLADDVYTPPVLRQIRRLTRAFAELEGVSEVISLTNAKDPIVDAINPPPLVGDTVPTDPRALRDLRETVSNRKIYVRNLVAEDGRAAAINVRFEDMSDEELERLGIDDAIVAILEADEGPGETFYSGLPHFKMYASRAMWRDLSTFVPLTLGIIVVTLFLSFRSVRGVAIPAAAVVVSLVWTLGLMELTGNRLSLGTTSLPPLLLVIGTAYSLHVIAEYYECARPGLSSREIVRTTLARIAAPVFLTAFTTALGFGSIAFNEILTIWQMGVFSAAGIAIAFLLSLVLVPALLVLCPPPKAAPAGEDGPDRLGEALGRIGLRAMERRNVVLAATVLLSVLAALPVSLIRVDSNFQSFFREDDPIRVATDTINERLVGTSAFYVAIDAPEPKAMTKLDLLERIRDLQAAIDRMPGVEKTLSFVDYVEALDQGAHRVNPDDILVGPDGEIVTPDPEADQGSFWDDPQRLRGTIQLISSSPDVFESIVTPDQSRSNILVRTSLSRSTDVMHLVEQIEAFAKRRFPPEVHVEATGELILLTRSTDDIVEGQVKSLALTASVIFVIMSVMFLSFRVGVLAMGPNLFPILVLFGLMGFTGTPLNLATSMIAAIALGIAIDDTIHIMSRLSAEVRETGDQQAAMLRTLSSVGKPAVFTSILLVFGFLMLTFSTFVPITQFGLLSAAAIIVALLAEVVLMPALVATTRIITLWDLLYLRLGPNPHRTIGIFESLRSWQAKIVALMGEVRSVPSGQAIVREGEVGNEMFVIIHGSADVEIGTPNGQRRVIRRLGRGDVFGEMALIRDDRRSADVIAVDDVEVMAMDRRFLERIQRRYPRIASKIFFNVARVLSDRLQTETRRV